MGQEIATYNFSDSDFATFKERLANETAFLYTLHKENRLDNDHGVGGFELEAWLIDKDLNPAPINGPFLKTLNDPLVTAELALFNIEINSHPERLSGKALSKMRNALDSTLVNLHKTSSKLNVSLAMTGILPTVSKDQLQPEYMSSMKRYRALNNQVMALRKGNAFALDITGREHIRLAQESVMMEAASTALQLQLQVDAKRALSIFNAATILSAPMVAVSANSPYLFGYDLWDETRIPLFEQSVAVRQGSDVTTKTPKRVTLGTDYVRESIMELFNENLENYHILLPMLFDDQPPESFPHLRLHNGSIWRWNRPLVGFSENGKTHLRIEHRVMPSGPTAEDTIANAAFFYGAVESVSKNISTYTSSIPFSAAVDNFYNAAKDSLNCRLHWLSSKNVAAKDILLSDLLPAAAYGLKSLGIDKDEADHYLDVVKRRIVSSQNGAIWQRRWVENHGRDMVRLLDAYLEKVNSGKPVDQWSL